MKVSGTRNYLEVKVGSMQCAEVVLHMRRQDVAWFNASHDELFAEFLKIMEETILPRMFADEMEEIHARETGTKLPPRLGPGGIPIAENNNSAKNLPNKKRKRMSKKALAELKRLEEEAEKEKKQKDVYHAFGQRMQLTYRLQEVKSTRAETLIFDDSEDNHKDKAEKEAQAGKFRALKKLSKRILVWCYPLADGQSSTDPDPSGGGFPRPELIPISDLFRQPVSDEK